MLARVPLLEHCATAMAVQAHGSPELAAALLPGAGRGTLVLTAAAHGRSGHDPAELAVVARRDGDAWILEGTQTAVPWAHGADWIAVPAHTGEGDAVLALVPRTAEGLALAEQVSTSGERLAELALDGVRVAGTHLIETPGAWERLRQLLATGTCALALGLGENVLTMTSQYTAKREQFGFPVATFQAVAVQAADRYIDLRAMEVTLWQAAWRLDAATGGAGGPCRARVTSRSPRSGPRRAYAGSCRPHSTCTAASAPTPTTRCTATTPGPSSWSSSWARPPPTRRPWATCWPPTPSPEPRTAGSERDGLVT